VSNIVHSIFTRFKNCLSANRYAGRWPSQAAPPTAGRASV